MRRKVFPAIVVLLCCMLSACASNSASNSTTYTQEAPQDKEGITQRDGKAVLLDVDQNGCLFGIPWDTTTEEIRDIIGQEYNYSESDSGILTYMRFYEPGESDDFPDVRIRVDFTYSYGPDRLTWYSLGYITDSSDVANNAFEKWNQYLSEQLGSPIDNDYTTKKERDWYVGESYITLSLFTDTDNLYVTWNDNSNDQQIMNTETKALGMMAVTFAENYLKGTSKTATLMGINQVQEELNSAFSLLEYDGQKMRNNEVLHVVTMLSKNIEDGNSIDEEIAHLKRMMDLPD